MPLKITRLEERIVLEAAAVDAAVTVEHLTDMGDPGADPSPDPGQTTDACAPGDAQGAESGGDHADAVHVLAISSTVDQAQVLAGAAMEGVLTYVYDGDDGNLDAILADIQDMLGGQKADSIAFATHDLGVGQFHLAGEHGVDTLSLATDADLAAFWDGVGDLLTENGRVDILACDVAGTDLGLDLLDQLSDITGHDVAGSDDVTGNPDAGGDWILETHGVDLTQTYFAADSLADFHDLLADQDKIEASTTAANSSIDSDGQWAVVGSPTDGDGVVKIYQHVGTEWVEYQTLNLTNVDGDLPSGLTLTRNGSFDVEGFGTSVAISGDHLIIGAPDTDYVYQAYERLGFLNWDWVDHEMADVGAAFTYTFDQATGQWQFDAMLNASGDEIQFSEYEVNAFGYDVDIDGDYLIVGEPDNDALIGGADAGRAHFYMWDGSQWTDQGNVEGFETNSYAGTSVAIDDSGWYAMGYPGRNVVYVNQVGNLVRDGQLIYGPNRSLTGQAVAMDGDTLVIGAPGYDYVVDSDTTINNVGAIGVYTLNAATGEWVNSFNTINPDPARGDQFGAAVDVRDDYILVGAHQDDEASGGNNAGAAYLYDPTTGIWTKVTANDASNQMRFGADVALGDTEMAMATNRVTNAGVARSAYLERYLNNDPTGVADNVTTTEDAQVTVDASTLLSNDTDADATDILTISAVGAAAAGTVTPVTNAQGDITGVTYDPSGQFEYLGAGETATDTFTYTVADGYGGTDEVTVTVTITGVNDATVISGLDDITINENTMDAPAGSWQIVDSDVTFTDVDGADMDGATLVIDYVDQNGIDTQLGQDRLAMFTNSEFTVHYWGDGNIIDRATGDVIGTIDPVENGSSGHTMVITFTAAATLEQAEHVMEMLAYRNYNDAPEPTRTLRVTFTDGDGTTVSDPAFSEITIIPENDPPNLGNGGNTVSYTEGDPGVVLNDQISVWDPELDPIAGATVTITNAAADDLLAFTAAYGITGSYAYDANTGTGTLTLTGQALSWQYTRALQSVTYENTGLNPTLNGTRAACNVDFQVTDNTGDPSGISLIAATTVDLTEINQAPDANPDFASTTVGEAVDINVLANDTDVDSNAFTVTVEPGDGPANGTLSINGGVVTYTPNANFTGTDSFTYTIDDGSGGTDTAVVTIDVYGLAHQGLDLSIVADDLPAMFTASTFDADTGTFYFAGDSFQGALYTVDQATGDWVLVTSDFTPENVYFRYDYSDIEFVNGTVYIAGDYDVRDESTYAAIDFWPGGTRDGQYAFLAYAAGTSTQLNNETLNLNEVDVRYGFATADGTTFFMADGWGTAGGNMVSFDLASPDALNQESGGVGWMTGVEYDASSGLFYVSSSQADNADIYTYDPATSTWSLLINDLPGGFAGNFAVEPGGSAIYHWSDNAIFRYDLVTGQDEVVVDHLESIEHFEYQEPIIAASSDGQGISLYFTNGDTLYEVDGIGDVDAADDSATTLVDHPVEIDLLANDTAVDGTLSVIAVGAAANGTVQDNGDGTVTYTPNAGFSGVDTFTYTTRSSEGGTDSATVSVEVYGEAHQSLTLNMVADDLPTMFTAATEGATGTLIFAGDSFQGSLYTVDTATGDWVQVTDDFTPENVYFRFDYSDIEYVDGTVYIAGDYDTRGEAEYTAISFWPDGGVRDGAYAFLAWNGASSSVLNDPSLNLNEVDVRYGFATADGTTFFLADGWGTAGGNMVSFDLASPDALNQESGGVGWMTGVEYDAATGLYFVSTSQSSNADLFTYDASTNTWTQLVDNLPGGFSGNFAVQPGGKYIYHWVDNAIFRFDAVTGEDQVVVDNLELVNHFEYQEPVIAASSSGEGLSLYFTNGDVLYEVDGIDEVVANHDNFSMQEDHVLSITQDALLANDTDDADPDALTIVGFTQGSQGGSLTQMPDGNFEYEPAENFNGTEYFEYTIQDADGNQDTARVTITVSPVQDAPVAIDDGPIIVSEDASVNDIPVADLLANDVEVDGDPMTITAIDQSATQGTVTFTTDVDGNIVTINYDATQPQNGQGAGPFDYLEPGETATDTFRYQVSDGQGGYDWAEVEITVTGQNDVPVLTMTDSMTVTENDPVTPIDTTARLVDFDQLGNTHTPRDMAGGSLTIQYVQATSGNTIDENNSSTYEVISGNSADNLVVMDETLDGVDFQDIRVNGTTLEYYNNANQWVEIGTVSGGEDGAALVINFHPTRTGDWHVNHLLGQLGYFNSSDDPAGERSILVTVTDAEGASDSQVVELNVTPVNDDPVAVDDGSPDATGFTTDQDTAFTTGNVLDNDSDVDNDHGDLVVTGINTTGTLGQVTDNGNGTFAYDPGGAFDSLALGESAQDTFTYTISDGSGGTATATVTITINGLNDAPVAGDDAYGTDQNPATNEDTPLHIDSNLGLLINDFDVDTDPNDPVNGTDPAPVIDDYGTQNGVDPGTGLPTYDHVSAMGASVTVNLDGSFDYDPTTSAALQAMNPGETATDTFTYTYLDRYGLFSTATVSIVVEGVNDAPEANDDAFTTNEDSAFLGDVIDPEFVWGADSDPEGMDTDVEDNDLHLASVIVDGVTYDFADTEDGFLTIELDNGSELLVHTWGLFVFNPNEAYDGLAEGETGTATFSYVLEDEHGGTDDATVTITIDGVNDAPFAIGNGIYQGVVNGAFEAGDTNWVGVINGGQGFVEFTGGELVVTGSSLLGDLLLGNGDVEDLGALLSGDFFMEFPWGANYAEQWMQIDTSLDFDLVSYNNFLWDLAGEFLGELGELGYEDLYGLLDSTPVIYVDGVEYQLYDDGTVDGSLGGEIIHNWNQIDESIHFSLDQFTGWHLIKLGVKSQFDLFPGVAVFDNVSDGGDVVLHYEEGYTVADNGSLTTPNVLANDMDIDSDDLTLVGFDDTLTRGTVTDNGDGTFTYNPGGAFSGLAQGAVAYDTFTYTMRDEHGVEHTATVVITITGTTPADDPGALTGDDLGLFLDPNFFSSLGHQLGNAGGGTGGGNIPNYGDLLAQGLNLFGNRDNPYGPSYPDNPFTIETYLENSDAAKEAFNNAIDQIPGVSQLTKIALKDFNSDILDLMFGDGVDLTLADLQDLVNDLSLMVQRMGPSEMAQFRGVLAVWIQSLKIQANQLAGDGVDVQAILDQLSALEGRITLTA